MIATLKKVAFFIILELERKKDMQTIIVDTREKPKAIKGVIAYFDEIGIKHISTKLYVGDYQLLDNPKVVVDRKNGLGEVCSNIIQDHERFRSELIRANEVGIKVYILIANDNGIKRLEDVARWYNPRLRANPKATRGVTLMKAMWTMQQKYGCEFVFCPKKAIGKYILDLLKGGDANAKE